MAKLGLTGGVAGRFRIEVRPGANGWAHVVVRKSRDKRFSIAADVTAGATFESEGLPGSADDFVSALVGLNSKNWLQLFNQVESLTDFNSLRLYLDKLAQGFVEDLAALLAIGVRTGEAFDDAQDGDHLGRPAHGDPEIERRRGLRQAR